MGIIEYLKNNKNSIVAQWEKHIIDNYPQDSGKFLLGNKNQFANPIGHTIRTELPIIFDAIISDKFDEKFDSSLENFIKVRAIQNYTAQEANDFSSFLKSLIDNFVKENLNPEIFDEYLIVNQRLKYVFTKSFEFYLEMKQKLLEIKLDEVKRKNQKMIERLNRKYGFDENEI